METFENNGKNISENFGKLQLKQNVKHLLYFHLVYIRADETDYNNFMRSLPNKNEIPLWHSYRVKGHKWVIFVLFKWSLNYAFFGRVRKPGR